MIVANAKVILTTDGHDPAGFRFSVLGPTPVGGGSPSERLQIGNPVFTRDQAGNPFETGKTYQFVIQHDEFAPEGEVPQVIFNEDGTYSTPTKSEQAPFEGNTDGKKNTPGWDAVCSIDPTTTRVVEAQNYTRPLGLFQTAIRGMAAWINAGQNKANQALEALTIVSPAAVKAWLTGEVDVYNVGVQTNTCKQIAGYFFNPLLPNVPATLPFYADGQFVANITATIALPVYAAQFGLPVESLIGFVYPVPTSLQDNYNHTFEIRHPLTGKSLATFYSPGNCGIQTTPVPVIVIDAQYEELPLPIEQNPPPIVKNPIQDLPIIGIGTINQLFPGDEFYDTDALTYYAEGWDGSNILPFPPGVTYDPKAVNGHGMLIIDSSVPDGTKFVLRRRVTDTANQPAAYSRLVSVIRSTSTPDPVPYVTEKRIVGPDAETEGGARAYWHVLLIYNNGDQVVYKGGGTASWRTGYPNGNGLSAFSTGTGEWSAQLPADSIEDKDGDISMLMRFTFPDGTYLEKTIIGINVRSNVNHPPRLYTPRGTQYVTQGQASTLNMPYPMYEFFDEDGDALTFDLQISSDGGQTYTSNLPSWISKAATSAAITAPLQAGQENYKLRVVCSDGHGGVAYDPFDLITSPPTSNPVTIRDRKYIGPETLYEGGAKGTYHAEVVYSDNSVVVWTGGGSVSWTSSNPAEIKNFNPSTGYWDTQLAANTLSQDRSATQRFAFPDGTIITKQITLVHVVTSINRPPRLVKPRGTIYVTQGKAFSEVLPLTADAFVDDDGDNLTYALEFSNDDGQTYSSSFPSWLGGTGNNLLSGTPPTLSQQIVYKLRIVCKEDKGGVAYDPFTIVSQLAQPTGTENCPNYAKLTDNQFSSLPQIVTYEYLDTTTPSPGRSFTVRPFATRAEAIAIIPTRGQTNSKCNFDFNKCTSATAGVDAILYNDDRIEHDGEHQYWPVEAGYWGYSLTLPEGGKNGSFVLLQTNACGKIVSRETITIYAN